MMKFVSGMQRDLRIVGRSVTWMKNLSFVGLLVVGCSVVANPVHGQSVQNESVQGLERIDYAIVAPPTGQFAQIAGSLYRVLLRSDQGTRLQRFETLEAALATNAEVIVIATDRDVINALDYETLQGLKRRKLVGFGGPAAELYGKLGLEMHDGFCRHTTPLASKMLVMKSELLGAPATAEPVTVVKQTEAPAPLDQAEQDRNRNEVRVLLQPKSEATSVDVIARWAIDTNYAVIARQGNCVLIGVEAPANQWSKEFIQLVNATCEALRQRRLEEFSVAPRELMQPGTYEFELDRSRSKERPYRKRFAFRFERPTRITARLEYEGSKCVHLIFWGCTKGGYITPDVKAVDGKSLELVHFVNEDQVADPDYRYLSLFAVNADPNATAKCKLVIVIE